MGLLNDLGDPGQGGVALDSSIFIYFVQQHPQYLPVVRPVFSAIAEGTLSAVTSRLTLLEVMVQPLRAKLLAVVERYEDILTRSAGLRLVPLDLRLLRVAAHLRAATNVKTPDAIQLASALVAGCAAFLTNDHRIPQVPGMRVLLARDYLPRR